MARVPRSAAHQGSAWPSILILVCAALCPSVTLCPLPSALTYMHGSVCILTQPATLISVPLSSHTDHSGTRTARNVLPLRLSCSQRLSGSTPLSSQTSGRTGCPPHHTPWCQICSVHLLDCSSETCKCTASTNAQSAYAGQRAASPVHVPVSRARQQHQQAIRKSRLHTSHVLTVRPNSRTSKKVTEAPFWWARRLRHHEAPLAVAPSPGFGLILNGVPHIAPTHFSPGSSDSWPSCQSASSCSRVRSAGAERAAGNERCARNERCSQARQIATRVGATTRTRWGWGWS